jgi:flavin-dependent dehydrogenase
MGGLYGATLLQQDGHDVTVLERDGQPPPPPGGAWEGWRRRGVAQFHLPHGYLVRFRHVVDAELPGLNGAFVEAGALRWDIIDSFPDALTGGRRPDDDRFVMITGRRPMMESAAAGFAAGAGVDIRRGVAVLGLAHEPGPDGVVHVTGVRTADGDVIDADLVVDCGGRRTSAPAWLRAIGASGPREERADSGFCYYARHYRSSDGSTPPLRGAVMQPQGSISTITLPADRGTWSVVITAASGDRALRGLADVERFEAAIRACPLVAHWIDAEPITGIDTLAGIDDVRRCYVVDGTPVATGIVSIGDAWTCTNPSLGRGISIGALGAVALRDALRSVDASDAGARRDVVAAWRRLGEQRSGPHVEDTMAFDRHRLTEMRLAAEGQPYRTDDAGWTMAEAFRRAAPHDPDLLRAQLSLTQMLARGCDVMAVPGAAERAVALSGAAADRLPGPSREELVAIADRHGHTRRSQRRPAAGGDRSGTAPRAGGECSGTATRARG